MSKSRKENANTHEVMIHNSSVSTSHAIHPPSHRNTFLKSLALGTRPLCRRRRRSGRVPTVDLSTRRLRAVSVVMSQRVRRRKNPSTPRGLSLRRRTLWRELLEAQQRSRLHETHGFLKTCVSSRRERWNFGPGPKSEISRSPGSRSEALRCSLESDFVVS